MQTGAYLLLRTAFLRGGIRLRRIYALLRPTHWRDVSWALLACALLGLLFDPISW